MNDKRDIKVRYRYERHWKWVAVLSVLVIFRAAQTYATPDRRADAAPVLRSGPCEVVEVIDGVTLVIRQRESSRLIEVRLMAVRIPDHRGDAESVSEQARAFTESFIRNRETSIQLDRRRTDRDGTGLVFLFAGEECLNIELARAGGALVEIYSGDAKFYQKQLRDAEESARLNKLGVWGD